MVDAQLSIRLEDSIQKTFRSYTTEFEKKAKDERKRYIDLVEKFVKDIIKDEVKSQLPQILPKEVSKFATPVIQSTITESLENVRGHEDNDKGKDPPAGSDQGLKKQKTSKDAEPSKGFKSKESKHRDAIESRRPSNPDTNWNAKKSINFRPPQTWISKIAKAEKPLLTFDELMSTPIDFSAYVINNLKIENLTQEHLVGPAFNLLKGTFRSLVELEYHFEEYRGHQVVPVNYFINNDLEYLKGGSSSRKYMTSTKKTKAAKYDDIQGIKDMVLLLWSLIKVSRGDCSSKRRSEALQVHAIDKLQLERRLMGNLKKFVGGREYREDFRLLELTI
ncbi:hypothetical protein Tco_0891148 [Tanacetum coccineum]|uniref:Uncharacterized protein n=1 Tax=Tanacetum coccineum TaxID=301880 RepID=A0ABQ5C5G5_9ASTR